MGLLALLKELWEAANEGQWARFVMLMGGPQAKRKDSPISIAKQWSDKPSRYQEPTGEEIIGIAFGNVTIPTRIHQWRVEYRPKGEKEVIRGITGTPPIEDPLNDTGLIDYRLAPLEFCQ